MKMILAIVASLLVSVLAVDAQMRIPSSVFTLEEIEEAKQEALEEEEPLVFVVTDPGST